MRSIATTCGYLDSKHFAQAIGVSIRRVALWVEYGYIKPAIPATGQGGRRFWSGANVRQGSFIAEYEKTLRPEVFRKLGRTWI